MTTIAWDVDDVLNKLTAVWLEQAWLAGPRAVPMPRPCNGAPDTSEETFKELDNL
jgi:hypothetical protein